MSNNKFGSLEIGLESLGCQNTSSPIAKECKLIGKCTPQNMSQCMERAMGNFPEAKTDIMFASVYLVVRNAKKLEDVQKAMPRLEQVLDRMAA